MCVYSCPYTLHVRLYAVPFFILERRARARHNVAHTREIHSILCSPRRAVVLNDRCLCFYFNTDLLLKCITFVQKQDLDKQFVLNFYLLISYT